MIRCGEGGCTTTRIEALNTDEPLIREDVQGPARRRRS